MLGGASCGGRRRAKKGARSLAICSRLAPVMPETGRTQKEHAQQQPCPRPSCWTSRALDTLSRHSSSSSQSSNSSEDRMDPTGGRWDNKPNLGLRGGAAQRHTKPAPSSTKHGSCSVLRASTSRLELRRCHSLCIVFAGRLGRRADATLDPCSLSPEGPTAPGLPRAAAMPRELNLVPPHACIPNLLGLADRPAARRLSCWPACCWPCHLNRIEK